MRIGSRALQRQRDRKRETQRDTERERHTHTKRRGRERDACVCERERGGEGGREGRTEGARELTAAAIPARSARPAGVV